MAIIVKSPSEIAAMRRAGMVVASILKILSKEIRSGMTTGQLDDIAVSELTRYRAINLSTKIQGNNITLANLPLTRNTVHYLFIN